MQIAKSSFRKFNQKLADKLSGQVIPLTVQWEITSGCNFSCLHCYRVEELKRKELSLKEITKIIDELHSLGGLYICFTGGEPFTRADFLDIYSYAKRKGFIVTIFSNGSLINNKIADYFKKNPPHSVEITLHSLDEDIYEKISGVKGSFKKCLKAIELLKKRNIPLTLKTVGMNLNCREIPQIKKFAEGLKAPYRFDPVVLPKTNGSLETLNFRLDTERIIDIETSDKDMYEECTGRRSRSVKADNLFPCEGGRFLFTISPYGQLLVCFMLRNISYDLRNGSLKDGLLHIYAQVEKAKYKTRVKCRTCQIRHFCRQCPGRALVETGDLEKPVEFLCRLAHRNYALANNINE